MHESGDNGRSAKSEAPKRMSRRTIGAAVESELSGNRSRFCQKWVSSQNRRRGGGTFALSERNNKLLEEHRYAANKNKSYTQRGGIMVEGSLFGRLGQGIKEG